MRYIKRKRDGRSLFLRGSLSVVKARLMVVIRQTIGVVARRVASSSRRRAGRSGFARVISCKGAVFKMVCVPMAKATTAHARAALFVCSLATVGGSRSPVFFRLTLVLTSTRELICARSKGPY